MLKSIANKKLIAYGVLCVGILLFLAPLKTRLLIAKSESLPHKVYFLVKASNWQKGDIVAINKFATKYTLNQHFTKRVVGIPGDMITVKGNKVFVNNSACAVLKTKTKNNKILTPIKSQVIPHGNYFVIAAHNDSFDSRYQEFGLVSYEYIEGKAYPIL